MMDLLPTFAGLAQAEVPSGRPIDGHDIGGILSGVPEARSPYEAFYYYSADRLDAVRSGRWKLFFGGGGGDPKVSGMPRLFDLDGDPGESKDVAGEHPEVVKRLLGYGGEARKRLGDGDRRGEGERAAGRVENPTARRLPASKSSSGKGG